MKQKHAELIKAWADGAEIEKRQIYCKYQMNEEPIIVNEEWLPCHSPTWAWNEEYRIKPESKPDYTTFLTFNEHGWSEAPISCYVRNSERALKLTHDGETRKLKSVEVLK